MRAVTWFFDHLPFLACFAIGIVDGAHGRTEMALLLFVLGGLTEIASAVTDIKRDVKAIREQTDRQP